jgi:DNA (cytosine-5)-methyltransferase 1
MNKLRVGTVFSGIGAFEQALEILNIPHEIAFACDNGGILFEDIANNEQLKQLAKIKNKKEKLDFVESIYKMAKKKNFVKQSYLANYDLNENDFYHDIRFIGSHINKEIDIFVGGSPCQSFSVAGARGGFEDTRGTLFFEFARCVKELQPKVFIYENVKGLVGHDNGKTFATVLNTFNELGYRYFYQILNAKDYNIPQNRQRIFIIGFKISDINFVFPEKLKLDYTMGDFLIGKTDTNKTLNKPNFLNNKKHLNKGFIPYSSNQVAEKYYLSDKVKKIILATEAKTMKFNPTINTDIAKTLLASMHKMHRANVDNYVTVNGRIRRLTPRECLRLMGFPDTFQQVVSDVQCYKQSGNSIVVNVLMELIKNILKTELNKEQ